MNPAALVYSHSVSPRLQYLVAFLSHYYGLPFRLIYDEQKFITSDVACKINYSYHRLSGNEIFIHSHALLFESSIRPVKVEIFTCKEYSAFFKAEGDVGFDLFAAIFFLITRYEEYLPYQKDAYGRFDHKQSIAFKEGFLDIPLVNIWLEHFRKQLKEKNEAFDKPARNFSFEPTYDIDMAWVYRNKGFIRNAGGILLLLLKARFRKMIYRWKVARKKSHDPYDIYEWLDEFHQSKKLKPVYFFLVAAERGKYDKNISLSNAEFIQLIIDQNSRYEIGLHPSWASGDNTSLLRIEKEWLEKIIQKPIFSSRQHFVRFQLPETYHRLQQAGIQNEYSMGYGTINGFRASITTPYYWYDLKQDEATGLLVHPFCFMDANSYYELKHSPEQAYHELQHYFQVVKKVNGKLITIWHNSFLGTLQEFSGWREVYGKFVDAVISESLQPTGLQGKRRPK